MGFRRCQSNAGLCCRTCGPNAGRYFGIWQSGGCSTAAIDDESAGRVHVRSRSGRRRFRCELGSPGRQPHRLHAAGIQCRHKVATRVAVLRDPTLASGSGQFGAIQAAASSFGVELTPVGLRNAEEIKSTINAFASGAKGGLIVTASTLATLHRDLIVTLASKHRLPTVYSNRLFVTDGGLLSYSPDRIDQFRRAAGYIDRLLKGEKPSDLPVHAPTKYELVINLKAAKAIGLTFPPAVLGRADEVIE